MISYTNKNVSFLSLILTVLIFTIFHLNSLFPNILNKSKFFSKSIYYSKIPINTSQKQNITDNNLKILLKEKKAIALEYVNPLNLQLNIKKQNLQNITINKNIVVSEILQNNNSNLEKQKLNQELKTKRQIINENKQITWRLQIPKINLDVHIKEGITNDILLSAVGHFKNTSKWNGNVGLAAHNRGYKCNFFKDIKNLKIGDEIIYSSINGKKVYKVQLNKIIPETDWSYLGKTKNNCITLITCEENRGDYRRCVQAVQIASYKT